MKFHVTYPVWFFCALALLTGIVLNETTLMFFFIGMEGGYILGVFLLWRDEE